MSLLLSTWSQAVAGAILTVCAGFIIYYVRIADGDEQYVFWNRIAPLLAMQLTVSALCMMNESKLLPGITLLISLGLIGQLLYKIYL